MMVPRQDQILMAKEGYEILKEHMIVYLAGEERTGKTLASIVLAELCNEIYTVDVITKRKAMDGWEKTVREYPTHLDINLTTYGLAKKELRSNAQLIILDEAHNYISSWPKLPSKVKELKKFTRGKPLIYLSATPHAQGHQMLFHQFFLSSWSPWKKYNNFYEWFRTYGIEDTIYVHDRQVESYLKYETDRIVEETKGLFVTRTRKEAGHEHEPTDKIHYIELGPETKAAYNELVKHKLIEISSRNNKVLLGDTPMKLRCGLHMIEGGVAKVDNEYIVLANNEKVNYIKQTWGDDPGMVIFYHYKAEKIKLEQHFKRAAILQSTSYAEGVDLSSYETLIVYSQDFSTAKHSQRRARQANMNRDTEIVVHYLLVEKAVSEQCYEQVSVNKRNFVDSVFKRKEL